MSEKWSGVFPATRCLSHEDFLSSRKACARASRHSWGTARLQGLFRTVPVKLWIAEYIITRSSVQDSKAFEDLLTGDASAVLADKILGKRDRRRKPLKNGTLPLIQSNPKRGGGSLHAVLTEMNKLIGTMHGLIEAAPGGLKRWRRPGRATIVGSARLDVQAPLAIAATNLLMYANALQRWETCTLK